MHEEIMTIQDVAKYLKTSVSTIYRLAQKAGMPAFKISGQWRFKKELIDNWIREGSLARLEEA